MKVIENKHQYHEIGILPDDFHMGKMICSDCNNAYIKWASDIECHLYKKGMSYKELQDNVHMYYQKTENMIYLTVTYQQKDIAKKLGANWDPVEKLWYTYLHSKNAHKLKDYMLDDDIHKVMSLERYNKVYGDNK